jgi:nitrite reductase (NO-forming)
MGAHGTQAISYDKLVSERPEYFVFNGAVGALMDKYPLKARVGEKVRLYIGNAGPNFTSAFHVMGGIFERVTPLGSFADHDLTGQRGHR